MIPIEKLGIILSPTENEFENKGTINSGVYQHGDTLTFLYTAVQNENIFSIGYAKTEGPLKIVERLEHPVISPEFDYEKQGVKNAKIVKIEDTFYITYTAYDGMNLTGAYATSKDLLHFEKQGVITPKINYQEYERLIHSCGEKLNPKYHEYIDLFKGLGIESDELRLIRDKNIALFPRKINGKFALLQCIWPGIQIVYFDDFSDLTPSFWEDYLKNLTDYIVLDPKGSYEVNHIGTAGPPIETDEGWLLIYYGVKSTSYGKSYHVKAALLQIDKPEVVLSRLDLPLFSPTKDWEKIAKMGDIIFPSGHALFGNDLYIYYGAACIHTAVAKLDINDLLLALRKQV